MAPWYIIFLEKWSEKKDTILLVNFKGEIHHVTSSSFIYIKHVPAKKSWSLFHDEQNIYKSVQSCYLQWNNLTGLYYRTLLSIRTAGSEKRFASPAFVFGWRPTRIYKYSPVLWQHSPYQIYNHEGPISCQDTTLDCDIKGAHDQLLSSSRWRNTCAQRTGMARRKVD